MDPPHWQQESPPAWTQEAYRLPCSWVLILLSYLGWPPSWLTTPLPGWLNPPPPAESADWPTPTRPRVSRLSDPPPPRCEQTENITFPILRMRAVTTHDAKAKVIPKGTTIFISSFIGDTAFTSVSSELASKWFRCRSQIHHDLLETGAISSTYCLTISKQFTAINHILLPASCGLLILFFSPLN